MEIKSVRLGAVTALIVIWYFVWVVIAEVLGGLNDFLWEVPQWSEEWIFLAPVLIRRFFSYVFLLYGQLAIIRYYLFTDTEPMASLLAGLDWTQLIAMAKRGMRDSFAEKRGGYYWKTKSFIGFAVLVMIWLFAWWIFSVLTYWICCSHFMGDQDPGDLPSWLDRIYPLPMFSITAVLGVSYLVIIYGAKLGSQRLSSYNRIWCTEMS